MNWHCSDGNWSLFIGDPSGNIIKDVPLYHLVMVVSFRHKERGHIQLIKKCPLPVLASLFCHDLDKKYKNLQ